MAGWISLHRQMQSHWLWKEKPFDKRSAWIDMLLMASHCDNKFVLGNELMVVEVGQFITSELKLMDRWGWSKTKVRSFLKLLQDDKMIVKKTDRKKTTINIVNYRVWQESETTEKPQKNHEETAKKSQKDTINNVNNYNNVNKDNKESIVANKFDNESFEIKICNYLIEKILENNPKAKVPISLSDKQKWAVHIDLMIRRDSRTEDEIMKVIKFATEDSFWSSNILSTKKLREKFDTLFVQSKDKKQPKKNSVIDYDGQRKYDFEKLEQKALQMRMRGEK